MGKERVQRRLAAILAADVVGYSRLMELDEQGTLARLKSLRKELFVPKTKQYGGRTFKITGDGALVEFASAVDAVNSAIDIQSALATRNSHLPEGQRIALRIGVSLGDIIVEGSDLYGNGVNVAARMQTLAEPGGICVSGNVHEHVGNVLDIAFEDLGDLNVKNIGRPVRSYRIRLGRTVRQPPDSQATSGAAALSDETAEATAETWYATRPALAVLPFANMSGDTENDYFADGLTEDIITALSYFRSFAVIARNSTFAYKGQSLDIRKVSADLGARYVIEGSVRKSGDRVRITVQLIDSGTGHHLWAERYDRELNDVFALQDEITRSVAAVIEAQLEHFEQTRLTARPARSLDAWEQYQRGTYFLHQMTKETNVRARVLFQQAIALDPNYSRAHSGIAYTYYRDVFLAFGESRSESVAKCIEAARRAVALDADDSFAHFVMSRALHAVADIQGAIGAAERATKANPNDYQAWASLGMVLSAVGRPKEAIPMLRLSLDLNPRDPRAYIFLNHLARAQIGNAEYSEAANSAHTALQYQPPNVPPIFDSHLALASALGHLGRTDDARAEFLHWRKSHKDFTMSDDASWHGQVLHECLAVGLRKAGLPEG